MCLNIVSPRAAAFRILAARYEMPPPADALTYQLARFQQDAVAHALHILKRRGGVLIADSVGLGKTFIASALIERYSDAKVVVVVPAAVRPMWRRILRRLAHENLALLSHGQLSRGVATAEAKLVVVDEAHAFRNPLTRRYRALRRICRGAEVVLLSATPVNNSLSDLMFQLRLWCADDAFRDLGMGSMAALLTTPEPDREALDRLRSAVVIRRTRYALRQRSASIHMPDGQVLCFPAERRLETIRHPLPIPLDVVESRLFALEFAAHDDRAVMPALLSLSILKRLQSSTMAALLSTERMIDFNRSFLSALAEGRLLTSRLDRGDQLMFTQLMNEPVPPGVDVSARRQRVSADLERLEELRAGLTIARDDKLELLVELLRQRRGRRTLVFSEFRETAEYLWRQLRERFPTALITGGSARLGLTRCSRAEAIRRFAPLANGAAAPPLHEAVEVLIATDVLAEGMNLQDADAVVSYDLPWNPVRLIQRAGRIDRLGSHHELIHVYNFMPDLEFEQLLQLVHRLRDKLGDARTVIRQEGPVLEPFELDAGFLNRLERADPSLLDEPGDDDPLRLAWEQHAAEAAPLGSIAAHGAGSTWLVAMTDGCTVRELLVTGEVVAEDRPQADRIMESALSDSGNGTCDCGVAVAAARAYLRRSDTSAGSARDVAMLARAIRSVMQRLGLLCPPAITAQADRLMAALPGYLGNARRDAGLLRTAPLEELPALLALIERSCTPMRQPKAASWTLLAAIAAD